ncbi:MAG: hypothetical protein II306_07700, partial [Clostridia bacterium]|nr:hypothetical protein [Clostridia bacterium]
GLVMKRLQKLLRALNDYLDSNAYYDDDKQETIIEGGKDRCYDSVMKDEEIHLLTSDVVKLYIDLMFDDWKTFDLICRENNGY